MAIKFLSAPILKMLWISPKKIVIEGGSNVNPLAEASITKLLTNLFPSAVVIEIGAEYVPFYLKKKIHKFYLYTILL